MLQCHAGYVATAPLLLSFKFVNGVQLMVELYTSIDAVSQVLEKYGDEFCEVVDAKLNLPKLERKKVITANLISKIERADGSNDTSAYYTAYLPCKRFLVSVLTIVQE